MKHLGPIMVAVTLALVMVPALASPAQGEEGKALVQERCGACHNLVGQPVDTLPELRKRKGPDLFYAGSKFRQEWLVRFLQKPYRLRPTGMMYLNHVVAAERGDKIVASRLEACGAKLNQTEAAAAASYLMTLRDRAMRTGVIKPTDKISGNQAERAFTKQYPCMGCHTVLLQGKPVGGKTGVDLTDAGVRLNPDWIYSRIENPQYWDPLTWMPKVEMSHNKRKLLTLFVASMKGR